jgi:hypothetical protein
MFRLSDDLARLLLKKMKTPKVYTEGDRRDLFTPVDYNGIGIADPIAAVGSEFLYTVECPYPVLYPELPYQKNSVDGFYLYRRIELLQPMESFPIVRALVDPNAKDYEETIDCSDCAILLADPVSKLVAKTISTLEKLIEVCPDILDCIDVNKK